MMLLRSSSTPLLGSLLPSASESPSNNHYQSEVSSATPKSTSPSPSHFSSKLSYNQSGIQSFTVSCNSPPVSPKVNGFRRVQSDGNLEGLVDASGYSDEVFSFRTSTPTKMAQKRDGLHLETIPSFSVRELSHQGEEEDEDSDENYEEKDERVGEHYQGKYEVCESYSRFLLDTMSMQEKMINASELEDLRYGDDCEQMHLAKGLGVADFSFLIGGSFGGGSGNRGGHKPTSGRGGGDSHGLNVEKHYKKMLEENPGNPLFLRNYAHFLYQEKRDLGRAEEYYSRAILADPSDGEVLSNYAKIVWELHRDRDRASNYFERAAQATDTDSHVHAAYANFLWEAEDDDGDEPCKMHGMPPLFHTGAVTPATHTLGECR